MFDIATIAINIGVIAYLIYSVITGGLHSLGENYIFIGYVIFTTLTLPNLISKVIFNSRITGYVTALSFLYFPIQFAILYAISQISGFSIGEIAPFGSIFNIILWNILLILFILLDEKRGDYSEKILGDVIKAMLPAILFTVLVSIFIRQPNSIVALDYLQHLTVSNKIFYENALCILPGQCSNLFLQHGYTTFYHIIISNISVFIGNNPLKTFYVLDVIYPVIASIPIYYIIKKFTARNNLAQLGVILSLSVFVMGGYDFVFFIPQTLALLFFLMIYKEGRLSFSQMILSTALLVATHFIIGGFLSGLLWFKYILIDNLKKKKEVKIYNIVLLLTLFFFILANISGFSFERLVQADALKIIGSNTNPYYPHNMTVYYQILGSIWVFVAIGFLKMLSDGKVDKSTITSISFLVIGSICYFLAPTYANKFTIGIGFFATLFLLKFISSLDYKIVGRVFISLTFIFIFGINFYIQYSRYLTFYTQSEGTVSAIVKEDQVIIDYLTTHEDIKYVVSDPYTQLVAASLGRKDTLQAQYMQLETRENLVKYLTKPNTKNYEKLLTSPGFPKDNDYALVYSGRLHRSIYMEDNSWLYNIYSLQINNNENILKLNDELVKDMERLGKEPTYLSDNFVIFK